MRCLLYCFLFGGPDKKCRTNDLTVIWQALENESFNWLTKTIALESKIKMQVRDVEIVYSVKTMSTLSIHSPMWC